MHPRIPTAKDFSRVYQWFLKLPVPVVLVVCWIVGMVLVGLGALAFYLLRLLLQAAVAT